MTWLATVGPDGKLKSLTLKRSSNSPAIDAAAKAWAEAAYYLAATDAAGAAIEGEAEVRLDYARWDDESPGGGLGDYRCADLVREAEWFAAANAGERKIFTLENFFTSMPGLKAMLDGAATPSIEERQRGYASRGREWQRLLQRCRRSPDRLFLDLVDDAPFYRSLVESF
mgnify:FL=1